MWNLCHNPISFQEIPNLLKLVPDYTDSFFFQWMGTHSSETEMKTPNIYAITFFYEKSAPF